MNIVLKNSLRNIIGKPLRTLLVTFSIFMCCMSAMLSFDLGSLIPRILENFYGNVSRGDIMVSSDGRDITELPEGFPECDMLCISSNYETLYKDIEGEYAYVTTDGLSILGVNIDEAVSMEFMQPVDLNDGELCITREFADDFGYEIGDTVTVHDRAYDEVDLTVAAIFPAKMKSSILTGYAAVVNENTGTLLSCGERTADVVIIDIKDDTKIQEGKDLIEAQHPGINITDMFINESLMNVIVEFELVFYLLFVATVLLVIFVTSSICNRIVSERMSYIGTLRSLGMSSSRTARILLLENVLYAVIGSVPATVIYTLIRNAALDKLFNSEDSPLYLGIKIPDVSIALIVSVILFAVVMECLIPLKAILKALKTSIRDIIFDNRDTAYRSGKASLVIGLILLAVFILCVIVNNNLGTSIICILSSIGALVLLFPRILKLITNCIRKICVKTGNSSWDLAAVEASSRKSTVGSGVLCATASAMCVVVVAVANILFGINPDVPYTCDVVAECNSQMKYYSYVNNLEGVTDVEAVYNSAIYLSLEGEEATNLAFVQAYPDGGFAHYNEYEDLPESIPNGGIVLDSHYAARNGINEGDTINVIMQLNANDLLPVKREFTVTALADGISDGGIETIVISEDEYISIYRDRPSELLICCSDPEAVKEALNTYGKNTFSAVKTLDELVEENRSSGAAVNAVITIVIALAIGMTAIGVTSNLLIGFEGRKKECAVLLSTAMSKPKLSGVLFKEVLITSLTASTIGVSLGTFLLTVVAKAFASSQLFALDMKIDYKMSIIFFIVLTIVFSATVLFPIKNLRKMKISEQIKYE